MSMVQPNAERRNARSPARDGRWLLATLIVLLMGCAGTATPPDEPADTADATAPSDTSEPASFTSTFEALQYKLFDGQGCTHSACHGVAAAGGLNLTAGVAYGQLVEVSATGASMPRVEPGDRSRSYLYLKLDAAANPEGAEIAGSPICRRN